MGIKNGVATANVIPTAKISTITQAIASFLPTPSNNNIASNYLYSYPQGRDVHGYTARLDANITSKQSVALISTSGSRTFSPLDYGATTVLPEPYTNGTVVAEPTTTDIVKHTYAITPHLVNQFRYGFSRFAATIKNPTDGNTAFGTSASLGIGNLPAGSASTTFPGVSFSGAADSPSGFSAPGSNHEASNTYTLANDVQWIKGRHSFTFGGDFQWLTYNQSTSDSASNPLSLAFNSTSTASYTSKGVINSSNTGHSYASFLIGAVNSSSLYVQNFSTLGARYKALSPFAQDDYKVTQKLTLNFGLRWDLYTPYREVKGPLVVLRPEPYEPGDRHARRT